MTVDYKGNLTEILALVRRPARYIGGEWNQIVKDKCRVRMALAYPDVYEIGMSNLGLRILYDLINEAPDFAAERVFAPWIDMEEEMRRRDIPLLSIETATPIAVFDVFGFSLQYEMTFTNVLNMLDLAGLPLRTADRSMDHPLVIAGGPCVFNPEPMAPFIDAFVVGEAEEAIIEILNIVARHKEWRADLLTALAGVKGVYVPSLYQYNGYPIKNADGSALRVGKRIIKKFGAGPVRMRQIVPFLETIHDRCVIEVMRGCTRGCRFCQAGIIYRPTRERPAERITEAAVGQLACTGYDEVSLASLSTTDHSEILPALKGLASLPGSKKPAVSLPSLRTDRFSVELATEIAGFKKRGLTFAPEAGTERLRRVINKGLTEEDILATAVKAFKAGWTRLKFYFMIGLPTETDEDVVGIADLVKKVLERAALELGPKSARRMQLVVSVSSFVPKPHSPFQWAPALSLDEIKRRQKILRNHLACRQVELKWHDGVTSVIEAALARGDRRIAGVLEAAHRLGCRFDGWSDQLSHDKWVQAFEAAGLDLRDCANSPITLGEPLPWGHIESGVTEKWLKSEYEKALAADETPDCRGDVCSKCGVCRGDVRLELAAGRPTIARNWQGNLA